jgi:hypothetical protein
MFRSHKTIFRGRTTLKGNFVIHLYKKEFWEELFACFPLIKHGKYRKRNNYGVIHRHTESTVISYASLHFLKIGKVGSKRKNYWVFGLFPSSGFLENRKKCRFGNWICFRPQVKGKKTPTQLGPLEKANLSHWTGSPFTWWSKQFQFSKRRVFYSIEYRTMEKVQKHRNFVRYTESSEPFKI